MPRMRSARPQALDQVPRDSKPRRWALADEGGTRRRAIHGSGSLFYERKLQIKRQDRRAKTLQSRRRMVPARWHSACVTELPSPAGLFPKRRLFSAHRKFAPRPDGSQRGPGSAQYSVVLNASRRDANRFDEVHSPTPWSLAKGRYSCSPGEVLPPSSYISEGAAASLEATRRDVVGDYFELGFGRSRAAEETDNPSAFPFELDLHHSAR